MIMVRISNKSRKLYHKDDRVAVPRARVLQCGVIASAGYAKRRAVRDARASTTGLSRPARPVWTGGCGRRRPGQQELCMSRKRK